MAADPTSPNEQSYGPAEFAAEFDVSRETLSQLETYAALLVKWNKAINLVSPNSLPHLWERHMRDSAQLCDLIATDAYQVLDLGSGGGFPGLVLAIMLAGRARAVAEYGGPDAGVGEIPRVEMVESDTRKATFLRTVARETGVDVRVTAERAEALTPRTPDVITARAFAPLPALLAYAARHLRVASEMAPKAAQEISKEISHGAAHGAAHKPVPGAAQELGEERGKELGQEPRQEQCRTICLFPKGQSWQDELTAAQKEWTIDFETIPSLTAPTGVVLKIRKFDRV